MPDSTDCVAVTQLWNTSRKISSCHATTSNEIPAKHFQELSTNMLCQTQRKTQIIISNKALRLFTHNKYQHNVICRIYEKSVH